MQAEASLPPAEFEERSIGSVSVHALARAHGLVVLLGEPLEEKAIGTGLGRGLAKVAIPNLALDSSAGGQVARHQARAGRSAVRRSKVHVVKHGAPGPETVNVRRPRPGVSLHAPQPRIEAIDGHEEPVWWLTR